MNSERETLAEFVTRMMKEKGLSHRKVAEATGNKLSHSTVADIASGQRLNPGIDTLTALARGLGIAADSLIRVAQGAAPNMPTLYYIYADRFDATDVTETEWQFLETLFRDQVERFRREKDAIRQNIIDGGGTPAKVVARIDPGEDPRREIERDLLGGDATRAADKVKKRRAG